MNENSGYKKFEESVKELEDIVAKLERGEMGLEESLEYFQRGMEISKSLKKRLDEIEKRVTIMIEDENGEFIEKDLEGENNELQK